MLFRANSQRLAARLVVNSLDSKKPETAITAAFGVKDSDDRRRQLSKASGLHLKHTTRIRQDMTTVVVHTDPKRAQQIRPLLDFYYLDETPVYLIGASSARWSTRSLKIFEEAVVNGNP